MIYHYAEKCIDSLNKENYAGFRDWSLPTLEEAMSLMEHEKKNSDLYIYSIFNNKKYWLWTSDLNTDQMGAQGLSVSLKGSVPTKVFSPKFLFVQFVHYRNLENYITILIITKNMI